ncbi:MAG: response regulator transcription factor [Phycisphaerales bacterium JB050]
MSYTILIADDDRHYLSALKVRLEGEGYTVVCAMDSYQALHQASLMKPDLMILDINMPAGDGFSVQDRLGKRKDIPSVPVIYLTGDKSERVTALARSRGAFALIFKPFQTEELLCTVREAIDSDHDQMAA